MPDEVVRDAEGSKVDVDVPRTNVAERRDVVDVITAPCEGPVPMLEDWEKVVWPTLDVH